MEYIFRPIDVWPRKMTPPTDRKRSPFQATVAQTYKQLDRELGNLQAQQPVVLQVALSETDIRLDGRMRATAPQPQHPGVIVAFTGRVGGRPTPLKFMCDDCRTWQDNLRAIVPTLERLRLADLYGVTKSGEQYAGWKALPGGGSAPLVTPPTMTVEDAARIVVRHAHVGTTDDEVIKDRGVSNDTYRAAAMRLHPDRGGDPIEWARLQQANDVLKLHHQQA